MKKIFFFALFLLSFYAEKSLAQGGTLDAGFGQNGQTSTRFRMGGLDIGYATAALADGKFLIAGTTYSGTSYDFFVARFLPDGNLDVTFGNSGKVFTDFNGGADYGLSIALQADGRIVVAGYTLAPGGLLYVENNNFAVARYLPDGDPDNSFGSGGKVVTAISSTYDIGQEVLILPDGKILVGGTTEVNGYKDFALVQYLPNGALDNTFANAGILIYAPGNQEDVFKAMRVLPDGKILVAGTGSQSDLVEPDFLLARFLPDGTVDAAFGNGGKTYVDFNGQYDNTYTMVLQPDGKVIIGGITYAGFAGDAFALVRLLPDGSLDTSFSGDGKVTVNVSTNYEFLLTAQLYPDGRILVAGYANTNNQYNFALARFQANGALDPSFNPAGTPGTLITPVVNGNNGIYSALLYPDGKILAAGYALAGDGFDVAMARYDDAGVLDPAFGNAGIQLINIGYNGEAALACAVQQDGKIVAVGVTSDGSSDYGLAGYLPNGTLDATFGNSGLQITDFNAQEDFATAIAIQPDGKLVVGGRSVFSDSDFSLARYLKNGTLDTSFDMDGKVTTSVGAIFAFGRSIALQPDGKILQGGYLVRLTGQDFMLVRYLPDGSLDYDFGQNGIVKTPVSQTSFAYSMALQSDGKIILGGSAGLGTDRGGALVRYLSNGQLDNSFSGDGILVNDLAPGLDEITALALQPDGKILAAGFAPNGPGNDFVLARYLPNGTLDAGFGNNGLVFTDFGGNDAARAMRLLNDGRIVLGGYHQSGPQGYDFALACYLPNGEPDPNFGMAGRILTDFNAGIDQINALAVQPDGKIVAAGYTVHGTDRDFALARYLPGLYVGTLDFSLDENSVLVYPNPIRTEATLEYTLAQDEAISIRLLDGQGRVVQTFLEGQQQTAGDYQQRIALPDALPAGWYVLVISGERGRIGIRIIK